MPARLGVSSNVAVPGVTKSPPVACTLNCGVCQATCQIPLYVRDGYHRLATSLQINLMSRTARGRTSCIHNNTVPPLTLPPPPPLSIFHNSPVGQIIERCHSQLSRLPTRTGISTGSTPTTSELLPLPWVWKLPKIADARDNTVGQRPSPVLSRSRKTPHSSHRTACTPRSFPAQPSQRRVRRIGRRGYTVSSQPRHTALSLPCHNRLTETTTTMSETGRPEEDLGAGGGVRRGSTRCRTK